MKSNLLVKTKNLGSSNQTPFEEYAVVFHRCSLLSDESLAENEKEVYAVGEKYFRILKLTPKVQLKKFSRVYVGKGERPEIEAVKGRTSRNKLPKEFLGDYDSYIRSVPLNSILTQICINRNTNKLDIKNIKTTSGLSRETIITVERTPQPKVRKKIEAELKEILGYPIFLQSLAGITRIALIKAGKNYQI